jgi:hypothetical protein
MDAGLAAASTEARCRKDLPSKPSPTSTEELEMGGHISVGVRRADGSFRTIGVWTNPLGVYMRDDEFRVGGKLAPLDRFFERYLNQPDDEPKFGGPQPTVPGEYGYVLVDETTMTITTMNGYSTPDEVTQTQLGFGFGGERVQASGERLAEMTRLRRAVVGARFFSRKAKQDVDVELPPFTTEDNLFAAMEDLATRDTVPLYPGGDCIRNFVSYTISFPAWTIVDLFPDTEENFRRMFGAVEAAVELTDEEKAAWQERYNHRYGNRNGEEN